MKASFSSSWKSSTQPRKQRKYLYNLPQHLEGTQLHSSLSKELRKKYGTRSTRVRVGDKVKVVRGQFRKKNGKVERISMHKKKVYVNGIEFTRKDGTRTMYPLTPSNLIIEEVKSDKKRFKNKAAKSKAEEK